MTHRELPLVVVGGNAPVVEFASSRREWIREALRADGAVLLRGFETGGVDGFDALVRTVSGAPLTYTERSSPRTAIKGNVYTSTEYPLDQEIFLHNENSYQSTWPMTLFFHCVHPPTTRGATPLADTRRIHRAIDPSVRDEFRRRRYRIVRNYHEHFGLPWQQVFNTGSREDVMDYCRRNDIVAEWPEHGLRTTAVRDVVQQHPITGEPVWFNHATVFHASTLGSDVRSAMTELLGEEGLPSNTYYGDGERIPDDVLDHLRSCYRAAATRFDYRVDDILVIDNMLTAHGREPFTGPRRIAVAMAEPRAEVVTA